MFQSALVGLSVCRQDYAETTQLIFTKFGAKVPRYIRVKVRVRRGYHLTPYGRT